LRRKAEKYIFLFTKYSLGVGVLRGGEGRYLNRQLNYFVARFGYMHILRFDVIFILFMTMF